jgi:hypothetical protein
MITQLSSLADSFPTVEVEYEDLLGLPYRAGGRIAAGDPGTDCAGVVLEIYRRAGLGLPDPGSETGIFGFASILEQVADCSNLYDLINLRRESNHLVVLVRPGLVLTASRSQRVHAADVKRYRRLEGVEYWRVRDACLP